MLEKLQERFCISKIHSKTLAITFLWRHLCYYFTYLGLTNVYSWKYIGFNKKKISILLYYFLYLGWWWWGCRYTSTLGKNIVWLAIVCVENFKFENVFAYLISAYKYPYSALKIQNSYLDINKQNITKLFSWSLISIVNI